MEDFNLKIGPLRHLPLSAVRFLDGNEVDLVFLADGVEPVEDQIPRTRIRRIREGRGDEEDSHWDSSVPSRRSFFLKPRQAPGIQAMRWTSIKNRLMLPRVRRVFIPRALLAR